LCPKRLRTRTALDIREELNATRKKPVSVTTVQCRLRNNGLKVCVVARKPLLRKQNKVKRLQWAKTHKNWSTNQWEKVLFTDESKFEIFGGKRRQYVRRQVGERMKEQCVVPTAWRCFGYGLGVFCWRKSWRSHKNRRDYGSTEISQYFTTPCFSVWKENS